VIRQRIALRTPALALVVRVLTFLLAAALFWYGLMVVLLAVKVSPHTVNSLSAYRTLYHDATSLTRSDFTTARRLIAGFAGLFLFLGLLYLAVQELPRPYLARGEVDLDEGQAPGRTVINPRAVERVAEFAAAGSPDVAAASGRLGDGHLAMTVQVRRAGRAADALRDVRARVRSELERHELPVLPVDVLLSGYEPSNRRELS